ncbi:MAG: cyclic nucleotide-binding domain-containing protein [Deltaproteobacteria bacterium]|nr:cyclic nucleotide-binding domain-containing protein [Deltaproteobacteria bacterium]
MAQWHGTVEFDFVGDDDGGSFVATSQVLPMLTQLLASGNIEEAVRLYEGADPSVGRDLLAQVKTLSTQSQKNLGQMFVLARDFSSAARIFEIAKRPAEAAKMFEQGGDFAAAARMYEMAGENGKAAAAKERAGDVAGALALFQKAGPTEAMAECLNRAQRYFEAAQVYQKLGNARAEVEMLRMVPIEDPSRIPAVKRLSDLLERHGHMASSAQLLMETLQSVPAAQTDTELMSALARRLEVMGRQDQAARVRAFLNKQGALAAKPAAPILPAHGAPVAEPPSAAKPAAVRSPVIAAPEVVSAPRPARGGDPFANLIDPFSGAPVGEEDAVPADAAESAAPAKQVDAYGQLKAIPIFGELALQDMKDLYRFCTAAQWPAGTTLIEQGEQGKGLIVIIQGQVQVVSVVGGTTKPLAMLGPGAYVGEISLVDDAPTSARVVSQTPVRALVISRERFQQYLYAHETAALRIYTLFTRTLAERLRAANKR